VGTKEYVLNLTPVFNNSLDQPFMDALQFGFGDHFTVNNGLICDNNNIVVV
jgi:hypothetical protein